ncbi:MAG: glutamate 5-kinase [Humidesulfovibrio sp.]|nr:glutamate 5-kinase [Humidesulfovibrio sp.]
MSQEAGRLDAGALRREILGRAKCVVVKVGSAVLTSELGLDPGIVGRLVDQIAALHEQGLKVVLVSSGAVAAGRMRIHQNMHDAPKIDFAELPSRQAASAIGQSRLMHEYDEAFSRFGKTTAQILLTREDLRSRARFRNARNTIRRLLDWGVIPIVNENDTVAVAELKFGDNDTLASLIVDLVGADLFVNLTSADGVFDKNPDKNPGAVCVPMIEDIESLDIEAMCDGKTSVGSGGMYSKLRAARRAAQLGVPTLIVSGKGQLALERIFAGEVLGTLVLPCGRLVSHRKFWLAYHDDPAGTVSVDAGAAKALRENGKSLLPAGIRKVEGRFERGALVRIVDLEGRHVGVGLSNYSGDELTRIQGRKSAELAEVLGEAPYPEAVHRDNLLLDAAL